MQIGFLLAAIIVFSSVDVNQKETASLKPTKMLVEVWCGGDDTLTRGVCIAAENAFESSADFVLNTEANNRALVVTIPTNVDWKEMNQRIRVFYTVEFSSPDAKKISKRKGACWEDDFATCATQIAKEAKIAQRKMTR
jgi:hypothetical protein